LIKIKRAKFEEVKIEGNLLIIGGLAEYSLVEMLLSGKLGRSCTVVDFDGYLAEILCSSNIGVEIEHVGELLKKMIEKMDDEVIFFKIAEYVRHFLRTSSIVIPYTDLLKENVADYASIFINENAYHEACYIARLFDILFDIKICSFYKETRKNDTVFVVSFRELPFNLKRFSLILALDHLSKKAKTTIIIPISIFGAFNKEEYWGVVAPLLYKICLKNRLVLIGDAIPGHHINYLLKLDSLVIAGRIFHRDLNILSQIFPQLKYAKEIIGREKSIVVISREAIFAIEDVASIPEYDQDLCINYNLSKNPTIDAFTFKILKILNVNPAAKEDLIAYLLKNGDEKKALESFDQILTHRLAIEYIGKDGRYWLRITPKGRLLLAKGGSRG